MRQAVNRSCYFIFLSLSTHSVVRQAGSCSSRGIINDITATTQWDILVQGILQGVEAEPGAVRSLQRELYQRLSSRCSASRQERNCRPARSQPNLPSQNLTVKIFAGGFTKSGNPLLILPDKAGFSSVTEGDLHLLLKYFISVVPKAEQVTKNHQKPIAKNFLFRVLALLWSLIEGAALYSKSRMSLTKLSCFFLLKSKRFSFCIITVKVKTWKKIRHFDKCPQYCR